MNSSRFGSENLKQMMIGAAIAGIYTVLSLIFNFSSFGLVQFRVAEILTILPVFMPAAIGGVTIGCLLSNIVGFAMGANVAGVLDIFLGTLATLIAALLTYALRKFKFKGLPVASVLPPILINAVVIGLELTLVLFKDVTPTLATINILQVGLGQLVMCGFFGLWFYKIIVKLKLDEKLFR